MSAPSNADLLANPWAFGPFCYVVGEVVPFGAPLLGIKGMLGRWGLDSSTAAVVRAVSGVDVRVGFTLQQPYASAIAYGPKRIENRPTRWIVPPEGIWMAIHAGATLYGGKHRTGELLAAWQGHDIDRDDFGLWRGCPPLEDLPRSAILGVMRIDHCLAYPGPWIATRDNNSGQVDLLPPTRGETR